MENTLTHTIKTSTREQNAGNLHKVLHSGHWICRQSEEYYDTGYEEWKKGHKKLHKPRDSEYFWGRWYIDTYMTWFTGLYEGLGAGDVKVDRVWVIKKRGHGEIEKQKITIKNTTQGKGGRNMTVRDDDAGHKEYYRRN